MIHNSLPFSLLALGPPRSFLEVFTPKLGLIFLAYMLVSLIRGACNDWGPMYLIRNKQQAALTGEGLGLFVFFFHLFYIVLLISWSVFQDS